MSRLYWERNKISCEVVANDGYFINLNLCEASGCEGATSQFPPSWRPHLFRTQQFRIFAARICPCPSSHSSYNHLIKQTPWPESASELYRPCDRRLSAKLVPTFANRGCRVVSASDPYSLILFSRPEPLLFLPSSSSIVLKRLSGSRSRLTTSQKIW
jgi:hypothetical protein